VFSSLTRFLLALAVIVLTSCGKLPRPFEPSARDLSNPLLRLNDNRGVVVAPIYGGPPEFSAPLADAISKGLRLHDIPATAEDILNAGNLLEGWYRLSDSRAGRVDVIVAWRLSDRDGLELFTGESRRRVLIETLAREPALDIKQFAEDIVPKIARAVIGDRPNLRSEHTLTVKLGEISGAPGDGSAALRRAVNAVLRHTDITVATHPEVGIALLEAQIEVEPQSEKHDRVRIVWTIRDSAQKPVAVMKQQNMIPKGRLNRRWGSIAIDIALAIRAQIIEAVRRLGNPQPAGLVVPPVLR